MRTAVVFLSANRPPQHALDFGEELYIEGNYDVFYMIDDEKKKSRERNMTNGHHQVVQISSALTKSKGYWGSVLYYKDRACAKDKALYYFSQVNKVYDFIWLVEEDVFIPTNATLQLIDQKHQTEDLLLPEFQIRRMKNETLKWHWRTIRKRNGLPLPWGEGMVCVCRLSRKFMQVLGQHVKKQHQLFIDESLYSTLGIHHNLSMSSPPEFSKIIYRGTYEYADIQSNPSYLYHPVKNLNMQSNWRLMLQNKPPIHLERPPREILDEGLSNSTVLCMFVLCMVVVCTLLACFRVSKRNAPELTMENKTDSEMTKQNSLLDSEAI